MTDLGCTGPPARHRTKTETLVHGRPQAACVRGSPDRLSRSAAERSAERGNAREGSLLKPTTGVVTGLASPRTRDAMGECTTSC